MREAQILASEALQSDLGDTDLGPRGSPGWWGFTSHVPEEPPVWRACPRGSSQMEEIRPLPLAGSPAKLSRLESRTARTAGSGGRV